MKTLSNCELEILAKSHTPKLSPTNEQVEVILGAIGHYNFDKIDAEMISGEGHFMYVAVEEDGVTRGAFFDTKGNLVGDWH